jgi:hypothetical protein
MQMHDMGMHQAAIGFHTGEVQKKLEHWQHGRHSSFVGKRSPGAQISREEKFKTLPNYNILHTSALTPLIFANVDTQRCVENKHTGSKNWKCWKTNVSKKYGFFLWIKTIKKRIFRVKKQNREAQVVTSWNTSAYSRLTSILSSLFSIDNFSRIKCKRAWQ